MNDSTEPRPNPSTTHRLHDRRFIISMIALLAVTTACTVLYVLSGVTAYRNLATVCMTGGIFGAGYYFGRQDQRQ